VKTPQNYVISLFGVAEVCKMCVPLILPRFVHEAWIIADEHRKCLFMWTKDI